MAVLNHSRSCSIVLRQSRKSLTQDKCHKMQIISSFHWSLCHFQPPLNKANREANGGTYMRDDVWWIFSDALLASSALVLQAVYERWNPCRLTDKETREKKTHGEEKERKNGDKTWNNRITNSVSATDKVTRKSEKKCLLLWRMDIIFIVWVMPSASIFGFYVPQLKVVQNWINNLKNSPSYFYYF
jgi:hypothetical protein